MNRDSPLVRQWALLRALCSEPKGLTIRELTEKLRASEKMIRRDLETFRAAGFPLEETVEQFGRKRWRVLPAGDQPRLGFAFDEAVALYLGCLLMEPLAGTMFWDAARRAFKKIKSLLSPAALKYIDKFAGVFHQTVLGVSDYSRKAELIDQLVMAVEDRRIIHLTYQSLQATEPVTYDVYPYGVVQHYGSLYLVGWAPHHNRVQHWKVDRIEGVEVTGLQFDRPEGFGLREHLAKSFGIFQGDEEVHVVVRFSPTVARYVKEGRWHASQKLTPQPDGSLVATFDLSTTEEIKRWLLSFGRHVEVLRPETLRHEMAAEIEALRETYQVVPGAENALTAGPHDRVFQATSSRARSNRPGGDRSVP